MIVIASVNGKESGVNYAHYISSKHGVLGLMKAVALELGPLGIRCNAGCCPVSSGLPSLIGRGLGFDGWWARLGHAGSSGVRR